MKHSPQLKFKSGILSSDFRECIHYMIGLFMDNTKYEVHVKRVQTDILILNTVLKLL